MPYKNGKPNKFCIDCNKQLSSKKSLRCKKCNNSNNHFVYSEEAKQDARLKRAEYKRQYYQTNKETIVNRRKKPTKEKVYEYTIRYHYKLEPRDFGLLLSAQENKCAICFVVFDGATRKTKPFIDHDHKTKKVRGLLCHNCNCAIGFFEENETFLLRSIEYLKRNNNENTSDNTKNFCT